MDKTVNEIYFDFINFISLKNKCTTVLHIKRKLNNYFLPYFGNMKLYELDESKYIEFQLKIRDLNYSDSFNKHIYSIANSLFNYLNMMYGIENFAKKIGYFNNNNINKNVSHNDIWTYKDFKKFIKKVDDPIYHALFTTMFFTGIRKGEALALKISDLQSNYLFIHTNLTKEYFNGKRLLLTPKSKKSNRKIRIDFLLKCELNRLIKYYSKNYSNFNSDFFLFGGTKPIATTTLDRKKNKYCDIAGVKRIRIHDLRHSHATLLYNKKIKLKAIQERLGHQSIATTMNIYVHLNESDEKRLITKINLIRL